MACERKAAFHSSRRSSTLRAKIVFQAVAPPAADVTLEELLNAAKNLWKLRRPSKAQVFEQLVDLLEPILAGNFEAMAMTHQVFPRLTLPSKLRGCLGRIKLCINKF
jgi:hypothetical protein